MIIDEIGGSMITLLPSCDTTGECVVGEISVESDVGQVIMNQAFQMTRVTNSWSKPTPPIIIALPESQLTSMLIVRKTDPIESAEETARQQASDDDPLNVDFLEFDELDKDELADSIKDIWVTELDRGADYYLRELLVDMIDTLNEALAALFRDELKVQNEELFANRTLGYDEKTGFFIDFEDPNWHYTRQDASIKNTLDIYLNNNYGYTLNVEQGDEAVYDYRVGVGNNTIDIQQR